MEKIKVTVENKFAKRLRQSLILLTLGLGSVLADSPPIPKPKPKEVPQNFEKEEESINLGEFERNFDLKIEIPGDRYIIHFADIHKNQEVYEEVLTEEEKRKHREIVIHYQKDKKELIEYLAQKYGFRSVFREGHAVNLPAHVNNKKFLDKMRDSIIKSRDRTTTIEFINLLSTQLEATIQDLKNQPVEEEVVAFIELLLLLKNAFNYEIENLEKAVIQYNRGVVDRLTEKYQKILTDGKIQEVLTLLRENIQKIDSQKRASVLGDNPLYYGAEVLLFTDGTIDTELVESIDEILKTAAIFNEAHQINLDMAKANTTEEIDEINRRIDDWNMRYTAVSNSRETAVINNILATRTDNKFSLLSLGAAHDLSDNIQSVNEEASGENLGLIVIRHKGLIKAKEEIQQREK